jgi:hypothetical protein
MSLGLILLLMVVLRYSRGRVARAVGELNQSYFMRVSLLLSRLVWPSVRCVK